MLILANPCDNFILMTDNDIYSAFTLYKICLPPVFPSISSLSILEAKLKNKLFMFYNYKITKEKRYIALKKISVPRKLSVKRQGSNFIEWVFESNKSFFPFVTLAIFLIKFL